HPPHVAGPEPAAAPCAGSLPAQLDADPGVLDDVVAVGAAGRGLQVGRAVEVAHSQPSQVAGDRGGSVQAPGRRELDAIRGGDRTSNGYRPFFSATDRGAEGVQAGTPATVPADSDTAVVLL